jgi:N-acetylmuramoyl-L-alanine amidase
MSGLEDQEPLHVVGRAMLPLRRSARAGAGLTQAVLGLLLLALVAMASAVVQTPAYAAGSAPQVTGIELREQGGTTTVAIDLSRRAEYRVFFLNEPMRAIIDLPPVSWSLPGTMPAPRGLVAGYRYGLFDPVTARLVLDLSGPARVRLVRYDLMPGRAQQRLVVEFEHTTQTAFDEQVQPWAQSVTKPVRVVTAAPAVAIAPSKAQPAAPRAETVAATVPAAAAVVAPAVPPPPAPRVAAVVPAPPSTRPVSPRGQPKHIVVLDAGHGGVDPGTIGIGGTFEKDVTLGMVRELRRQLEATGRYKVVLTRDEDIFIRLRDRVAKARAAGAELFVSIHADSIRNRDTRGASIYTLSETASDDEAAGLAARENRSDIIAGVDLSHENKDVMSILIDLAQRETMNRSATFAGLLVDELGHEIQLIPVKPHRFAGFAVLRAPDVPAALIELGYLSNRADEQLLTHPKQRAKVASSITHAIDAYFQRRLPPS